MKIAVDAVGGDFYPKNPVLGAIDACSHDKELQVILVGPEQMIEEELEKSNGDKSRISILHASEIILMDESPASAVKSKINSSIVKGIATQKEGMCDAFVSAGNTGALLAASTLLLGKLEGVFRPTIAAMFPTVKGFRVLVDAGANLDLKPEFYVQFAVMATVYAREVMQIPDPTVGLLNVGHEPEKGTEILKEAHLLLKECSNFSGNIEGKDIFKAETDIFLCNGMVGNILLKFGESFPETLHFLMKDQFKKNNTAKELQRKIISTVSGALDSFNYEHVGGVPFLGVNGVSMVGHGGSTPVAIKNMILNAAKFVKQNVNDKIISSLN